MADPAAQLARLAIVTPPKTEVRIFLIDRGYSVWAWLCPKHKQAAIESGWEVKEDKDPPHKLKCDWRAGRGACS